MKYIELHDERDTIWVKVDDIGLIKTTKLTARPQISSYIILSGYLYYCIETPEEILQKIAEGYVKIIRCNECKHYKHYQYCSFDVKYCYLSDMDRDEDFY